MTPREEADRLREEAARCPACGGVGYLRGLDIPARAPARSHDRPCTDCHAARLRLRELTTGRG